MTDSPIEHPLGQPDTNTDQILGETTGDVVVFHRTHGFIRAPGFGSVFVHVSNLEEGRERLEPGQRVHVRIRKGRRGRYADQVRVLHEGSTEMPSAPTTPPASPMQDIVLTIARRLGERESEPINLIRRLVKHLGPDVAWTVLDETEQLEAQGGMLLPNKSRRRTPGGVFFALARDRLTPEDRANLFPKKPWKVRRTRPAKEQTEQPQQPQPAPQPITWEMRGPLIDEARVGQGRATTVKVTVIGRPESIVERGNTVILMLTHRGPLPSLPKGVPTPAEVPTTSYVVYVAAKQWRGVAEPIKDPEDSLIIEGTQVWDAEQQVIAVYTTKIGTKLMQRAKRPAPPAEPPPQS
ncbi:cold shock domain-containing protein [Oscillochloris sp. ZM17-4]|uniref:cold shock domain-containing protein n=1 Tax=Oscillochloris sp. ZM17-4 TaxID=2866714 RepID=UPI001C73A0A8|nr:cold shock domain-containing protein [Oscillochloris sp. ZM17-4]MBX0330558.1 cold shock domain-containing protein [Oscillochloris sp. ZM17-4]